MAHNINCNFYVFSLTQTIWDMYRTWPATFVHCGMPVYYDLLTVMPMWYEMMWVERKGNNLP